MNNETIYYVSLAAVALIFTVTGLREGLSEGVTVGSGLLTAGGVVLLAGTALQWLDSSQPEAGRATWVATGGGLLVLLGSLALLFL